MTDYNDGKWHGWNGGECPVHPESLVDCYGGKNAGSSPCRSRAKFRKWQHDEDGDGVVAFRVIKEHKEPREFWVKGHVAYASPKPNAIHVREVLE